MQTPLWIGVGAALALAVIAGVGQARRHRRRNVDDVGFMPWQMVQMLALIGAGIMGGLALGLI